MADNYSLWSFAFKCSEKEFAFIKKAFKMDEDLAEPVLNGITYEYDKARKECALYSEMDGTPDGAANLVQSLLYKFKRTDAVYAEGAYTCSKPRPGEFGGWCVEIEATGQKWENTGTIISRWNEEREKRVPK